LVTQAKEFISIPRADFLASNDRLSKQYHKSQDPAERREIVAILYNLDIGLFRAWRVFGEENRRDYQQEAFLWLTRALETFKPGKGAFIPWLKYYILKAQAEVSEAGKKTLVTDSTNTEIDSPIVQSEGSLDTQFWAKARKLCTDDEWAILEGRMLLGLPVAEAKARAGLSREKASSLYANVLQRIRIEIATQNLHDTTKKESSNSPIFTPEPTWVGKKWLQARLQITDDYLKNLLDPNRPASVCPFLIDPIDVLAISGTRIRYWETPTRGLVHPRIIRRRR